MTLGQFSRKTAAPSTTSGIATVASGLTTTRNVKHVLLDEKGKSTPRAYVLCPFNNGGDMKFCTTCKEEKELSEFHKKRRQKDGLQTACKSCCKIRDARSYAKSPERRELIKRTRTRKTAYNRELVNRYKRFLGCQICQEKEPVVLDLHHRDPLEKDKDPSTLRNYSTERLKAEIRKCAVLCANCHRKVHAGILSI